MNDSAYLLDSNVWIALTFDTHPAHRAASEAFLLATEQRPAMFCRATQQSYLRLASNPTILQTYCAMGLTNRDALKTLGMFIARPVVAYRNEPDEIVSLWHQLADLPSASPKVWMDAYLAAFAITGKMTMMTLDRDFASYKQAGLELIEVMSI